MSISIVIPAHNEATVIDRCLRSIVSSAVPGELDVVVVCNGCSDETANIARRFGAPVRVIETEVASKPHALNLGDRSANGFPRFFIDADVIVPLESVRRIARALATGPILAAAPRIKSDFAGCSWAVRAYHKVWMNLPYVQNCMLGAGVYALSEAGRARFDRFPDMIADDEFVRMQFSSEEKASLEDAHFIFIPPHTFGALIHINVRRYVGALDMRRLFPEAAARDARLRRGALLRLALRPPFWPSLAVYAGAKACTLALFVWRKSRGAEKRWARDPTSRE